MDKIIAYLRDFNIITITLRLILAVLLGGIIGTERGLRGHAAGLRTHILVCVGSAMTSLIGLYTTSVLSYDSDPMRISAQVISGIGFLGVGTILLKGRFRITGLTTAAGLWAAASVGLAAGVAFYEGAVIGTLLIVLAIMMLPKLEARINRNSKKFGVYMEITDVNLIKEMTTMLEEKYGANDIQVTSPRSAIQGHVGIEATIWASDKNAISRKALKELSETENVLFAIESI